MVHPLRFGCRTVCGVSCDFLHCDHALCSDGQREEGHHVVSEHPCGDAGTKPPSQYTDNRQTTCALLLCSEDTANLLRRAACNHELLPCMQDRKMQREAEERRAAQRKAQKSTQEPSTTPKVDTKRHGSPDRVRISEIAAAQIEATPTHAA